jgi:hypothetical protein
LDIAYNLSPKAEIKNLLDEIEKELNSWLKLNKYRTNLWVVTCRLVYI